jgi:hypothetical protein
MALDSALVKAIKANLAGTPSAELREVLQVRDLSQWSEEAFAAAQEVLDDRAQGRATEPEPLPLPVGETPGSSEDAPKDRVGCLTAWLVLMVVGNSFALVALPLTLPPAHWVIWPTLVSAVLNVAFAIALLNWKKWGFFGALGTSLVGLGVNLYELSRLDPGSGIPRAAAGGVALSAAGPVLNTVILFALLRVGEKSGWSQLE